MRCEDWSKKVGLKSFRKLDAETVAFHMNCRMYVSVLTSSYNGYMITAQSVKNEVLIIPIVQNPSIGREKGDGLLARMHRSDETI